MISEKDKRTCRTGSNIPVRCLRSSIVTIHVHQCSPGEVRNALVLRRASASPGLGRRLSPTRLLGLPLFVCGAPPVVDCAGVPGPAGVGRVKMLGEQGL